MKIKLGYRDSKTDEIYGTIENTAHGFVFAGNEETLRQLVEYERRELLAIDRVAATLGTAMPSDAELMRFLVKRYNGSAAWSEIQDAQSKSPFDVLLAAYRGWDAAWAKTIQTTGLRPLQLPYGLPGDQALLEGYRRRYSGMMLPDQQQAFDALVVAFRAWLAATAS